MNRTRVVVAVVLGAALLCGGRSLWRANQGEPPEQAHAAPLAPLPAGAPSVASSAWLAAHFPPPSAAVATPECASCHVAESAAWAASPHAGVVSCGDCHVRGERVYGPGADVSATPATALPSAALAAPGGHAPSIGQADLRSPAFCAPCHDRAEVPEGGEGKPLSELTAEWARTPAAQRGETCQSCHMPEGAHRWRSFTDVEFVRGAFTARAKFISDGVQMVGKLTVTASEAVGHRLPSGVGRALRLTIDQLDRAGLILEGTHRERTLGRRLDPEGSTELFDTRLLPGESHELRYTATLDEECAVVRARVELMTDPALPPSEVLWEDKILIPG